MKFELEDKENIEKLIFQLTKKEIKIKKPENEFEEKLIDMGYQNCLIELSNYLMDLETRESQKALKELQRTLKLAKIPKNIEAFDISNIAGNYAVGAMVKFVNGLPEKNEYRKFKIKTVEGIDDFKMMEEVVYRRYKRLKEESKDFPDLILIDGGKGQLSSAISALEKCEIKNIPVIALAKKEELIYLPNQEEPLKLSRTNLALKLLQNIRDESHRFAIEFHRKLYEKEIKKSLLDEVEGIGETIKNRLLKKFGSIEEIIKAPIDELVKIKGVTTKIAEKIKNLKI
jgi:excinuclease ABC subunit C